MTDEQFADLLEQLTCIADELRGLNKFLEAASDTNDEGIKTIRMYDVCAERER